MASIPALDAAPFSRYFSELALLLIKRQDGGSEVYSIVRNRELKNVSWILGEDLRLAPRQDTLTITKGALGAYPNMFFLVNASQLSTFTQMAVGVTSPSGYDRLVDRFGVPRSSARFWEVFDEINEIAHRTQPIDRGTLDLTRYELDKR